MDELEYIFSEGPSEIGAHLYASRSYLWLLAWYKGQLAIFNLILICRHVFYHRRSSRVCVFCHILSDSIMILTRILSAFLTPVLLFCPPHSCLSGKPASLAKHAAEQGSNILRVINLLVICQWPQLTRVIYSLRRQCGSRSFEGCFNFQLCSTCPPEHPGEFTHRFDNVSAPGIIFPLPNG